MKGLLQDAAGYALAGIIGWIIFIVVLEVITRLRRKRLTWRHRVTSLIPVLMFCAVVLVPVMINGAGRDGAYERTEDTVFDNVILTDRDAIIGEENIDLEASHVCLIEAETGTVIYARGIEEKIAPASTTKMLTALTVLEFCEPGETVIVGDELGLVASDSSIAYLQIGDTLTVKQLLAALLVPSGNDAAYVLAVYTARRAAEDENVPVNAAIQIFTDEMNRVAESIGARNSHFVNPDGYDHSKQYTTAADLACIARQFMSADGNGQLLSDIVDKSSIRECFASGKDVTWWNTNQLIDPESSHYYPDAVGLKTGASGAAGKCLVSAVRRQGELYIAVVMGSSEEGRFTDSIRLYEAINGL